MQVNFHPAQLGRADPESFSRRQETGGTGPDIVIGLVNIMPASAMRTTENLFRRLLTTAAPRHNIQLRLFAPHAGTREISGASQAYESLENLWNASPDGAPIDALIVTGTESQASRMEAEPLWPQLQKLCGWAGENTISTIWSCFSAHAAVLHMDGISRRRLLQKRSGVFHCKSDSSNFLTEGFPRRFLVPHSRYHDLAEAELRASNYQILSQGPHVGVDSFTKQFGKSQFLFLQGHLEYSPHILLGEYCRDLRRFAANEIADAPLPPENYFAKDTLDAFAALREHGGFAANGVLPPALAKTVVEKLSHSWREPAQNLYAAWLRHVAGQKIHDWNQHLALANKAEAA